jgi:hypothetical protein
MVAIASGALLASGCGGPTPTVSTTGGIQTPPAQAYLSALSAAQARLAAAERAIPRRPKTPRALAHAISLLRSAVRSLGANLAAIHPPASVAGLHRQLVARVDAYAAKLSDAVRAAARPGGELTAADLLSSATGQATREFSTTVAKIDQALGVTR